MVSAKSISFVFIYLYTSVLPPMTCLRQTVELIHSVSFFYCRITLLELNNHAAWHHHGPPPNSSMKGESSQRYQIKLPRSLCTWSLI